MVSQSGWIWCTIFICSELKQAKAINLDPNKLAGLWNKCIYKLGSQTQFTCSPYLLFLSSLISKWWTTKNVPQKKCWRNTRERQKIRLKNHLNQIVGLVAKRKWLFWCQKTKNTDRTSMPFLSSPKNPTQKYEKS